MNIEVLTLFPEIMEGFFQSSIMKRAVEAQIISFKLIDFREFALDRHRTCDETPYGGGPGMVIKPEPIGRALESLKSESKRVIFPSPSGRRFTQAYAEILSQEKNLLFVCGHYEGLDQRIIDKYVDDEICIGDYVVSSGETAALVIIDAVFRLINGVIAEKSLEEESFCGPFVEYPQYTRPEVYKGMAVPQVLLSGNHAKIASWRLKKRLEKTMLNRPELYDEGSLDLGMRKLLKKN